MEKILTSITDPANGRPTFGSTRFDSANFPSGVNFESSLFKGVAVFEAAEFEGPVNFGRVEFDRNADFRRSSFDHKASFVKSSFMRVARFEEVTFSGTVAMNEVNFRGGARFTGAKFINRSHFEQARFFHQALFKNSLFKQDSNFSNAHFAHDALFDRAVFEGSAWFGKCQFESLSSFVATRFDGLIRMERCTFSGPVQFEQARLHGNAEFGGAKFKKSARFTGVKFCGQSQFKKVNFDGSVSFRFSSFVGAASFSGALFAGTAGFDGATFDSVAKFDQTSFPVVTHLGPIVCLGTLHWSGAEYSKPVTIELAAPRVRFRRTRFDSAATIKVRYAAIDLTDAALSSPVTVTSHPTHFMMTGNSGREQIDESRLSAQGLRDAASVVSVRGVDVSHLVLTDVSLADCEFSGAVQLDKIRLQGDYRFPQAPKRWRRLLGVPLLRATRRVTLAEEQYWRANKTGASASGWKSKEGIDADNFTVKPRNLAATYRELRKSLEDSKNEPDAADFYYGEMEMRRHDKIRPTAERLLLTLYWLISGYGLRAMRSFSALLIALLIASSSIMFFGLPSNGQSPRTVVTATNGGIVIETETSPPTLSPQFSERVSWSRFEEANRANLNSVFFRRSGITLTTLGVYIQMLARLIVPAFFVLGVLAIRNRVKR
ncbi:pentapeptide repeat-containing protein [Streptomyces sp. AK08-02]|uniref:pentapeptide repeat-containing protein n=1 Tax=Streptomyces sp. AK08-02 TaxID=3028654 RepID=UPI0029A69878|nr:pentapeptide repeat-containing protein [Streptomyces sp. AK08-02]MDX3747375.1 pentapeptide repeat-containing protein [Streptomyces sp. AK08-02]